QVLRCFDPKVGRRCNDLAQGVDVPLYEVAAEPVGKTNGSLQVDRIARLEIVEVRALQGLVDGVRPPPALADLDNGQTAAIHGDRVADLQVFDNCGGAEGKASAVTL